uniref:MADF domain-containing protein n=1 Tax=Ascaris lumbricoides TaxID=6252 RepID=A0A0M3ILG2_ASCLU
MAMFGMSDDKKSLLIQEVYQRPLLWMVSDPKYTHVPSRWAAYEEIAVALGDEEVTFSSDMVKLAWKNMLDYYNQIRRRYDRAALAGINVPNCKWQFYSMMHFTRQGKPPVRRRYNWMEPSKIPKGATPCAVNSNLNTSNGYCSTNLADLPKSIPIRPTTSCAQRSRSSKKQPVRSKHRTKSAMVDETLKRPANSAKKTSPRKRSPRKEPNNGESYGSPQKRRRGNNSQGVGFIKVEKEVTEFITRRGRRSIRRRLSLSPPPTRARVTNASKKRPVSMSPRKSSNTTISRNRSSEKPITADDAVSIFARWMAARLFVIKSESMNKYAEVCRSIDNSLNDSESLLDVKPVRTL